MMIAHHSPRTNLKQQRAPRSRRTTTSQPQREILSVKQIESKYPSEWVLLKDPITDKHLRVLRGEVVYHSKDRDAVGRRAIKLRLKHSAFLFTGKPPADMDFLL
jgi:hypothetical protein